MRDEATQVEISITSLETLLSGFEHLGESMNGEQTAVLYLMTEAFGPHIRDLSERFQRLKTAMRGNGPELREV